MHCTNNMLVSFQRHFVEVGSTNQISEQQGRAVIEQMIEHSYKTDPRITLGLWRSFCVFVQSMKDLGSVLQLRMFNNRLEKHFFVILNNNVEGTISPTMHLLADITIYHTSNSHECMGVNGEALQLNAVYKKPYFLLQVTRESVSVLQVT